MGKYKFFPEGQTLRGCAPSTRDTWERFCQYFADFLGKPLKDATADDFWDFLSSRPQPWANSTERLILTALKTYYRTHEMAEHPITELHIEKADVRHTKPLSEADFRRVLHYANTLDRAIMLTMWATFCRRHEVAGIRMDDLELEAGLITIYAKGAKRSGKREQRKILSPEAIEAITAWLAIRPESEYLFCWPDGKHFTPAEISNLCAKLSRASKIKFTPHRLRAGGATHAVNSNVNARLVMQQGGWSSFDVFKHYTEQADLNAFADAMWGGA